jgi:hypothetical protein
VKRQATSLEFHPFITPPLLLAERRRRTVSVDIAARVVAVLEAVRRNDRTGRVLVELVVKTVVLQYSVLRESVAERNRENDSGDDRNDRHNDGDGRRSRPETCSCALFSRLFGFVLELFFEALDVVDWVELH